MRAPRTGSVRRYVPVGLDLWDHLAPFGSGELVTVVQPGYGCPRNGTMGHCFVESATSGPRLVLVNSLQPTTGGR
jgi:hypothetical protein